MAADSTARTAQSSRLRKGGPDDEGRRACDGRRVLEAELELKAAVRRLNDRGAGAVHV
jgi:hypothetical protein